jgi:ketosteroid isomerase-like protein
MSANLDLVRSLYAAWERGDFRSTDWAHPEIEWLMAGGPTPGRWTGRAEMTEGWRDFLSAWADFHAEVETYREIDEGRVLVLVRRTARGKTSRVQVDVKAADLFHIKTGKVTKFVAYWDRDRALADLGLKDG